MDYIESSVIQSNQETLPDYNYNNYPPFNVPYDKATKYRDYFNKSLRQLNLQKKTGDDVCTTDMAYRINSNINMKQKFCLNYNEILKNVNLFEQKLFKKTKIETAAKNQYVEETQNQNTQQSANVDPPIKTEQTDNVETSNNRENISAIVKQLNVQLRHVIDSPNDPTQEEATVDPSSRTDDSKNNNNSSDNPASVPVQVVDANNLNNNVAITSTSNVNPNSQNENAIANEGMNVYY